MIVFRSIQLFDKLFVRVGFAFLLYISSILAGSKYYTVT